MPQSKRIRNSNAELALRLDRLTTALLCAMLAFSPWAFGTTQPWSITIMNACGYTLGVLCQVKQLLRGNRILGGRSTATVILGILTFLLLAFVFVSALNASATYLPLEFRLLDHKHISSLPHSYDAPATWAAFWKYLALAGAFWATHDWVASDRETTTSRRLPGKLRLLLWIISANGGLLALECIIQRVSGTADLLWFQPTHTNKDAVAQFGPYAYRSNAAQYLNLIWPMTLGFWWWLQCDSTAHRERHRVRHLLLPCVIVMAAASLFSLSRAGAGVAALLLVAAGALIAFRREAPWQMRIAVAAISLLTLAAGWFVSWNTLSRRFVDTAPDPLIGRRETYQLAEQMARDYPWWGTGPGTFNNLFQIYRNNPEQYWPVQLHNDWLEFRITFGRVGFVLMLAALALATLRWLVPGNAPRNGTFLLLTTLGLAGCLLHARVDFPFQIYSIEFLFLVLAAILFSSSRGERSSPRGLNE